MKVNGQRPVTVVSRRGNPTGAHLIGGWIDN